MEPKSRRVVVVANRLPVTWDETLGEWAPSPGGLVSALTPILKQTKGSWVGWTGLDDHGIGAFDDSGIRRMPVEMSEDEYLEFYVGFCNGTLWPLYHSGTRAPEFHRHWWRPYVRVNEKFAEAAASELRSGDIAWVQDYQLQLVPQMIRARTQAYRIGFYLHIPFPPVELFSTLPWRKEVITGLLGADVIAFQSSQSRANFADAAFQLTDSAGSYELIRWQGREVSLQVAPIGIDAANFEEMGRSASTTAMADEIRKRLDSPDVVILGVDRLDYTKGIDHRIRALQTLLERRPDLAGKVAFVQIAVPSREDVPAYQEIRGEIEALVGRVNGDFARVGRPPVHYLYRSLPVEELVGYYRAADIMLVTPLRDGMNLVAKEYVATRWDDTGILVLSEFAGAAEQLGEATLVNPYHLDGLADALEGAIYRNPREPKEDMALLRSAVSQRDVFWWAGRCLEALGA